MSFSPNKGYDLQTTGSNVNTWGVVANANFSKIDANLGGTLALSVAGNTNVTITSDQAQNLIYNLTGVLTGNINVTFPQAGGIYFINNATTGNFTLTFKATGCSGSVVIPQATQVPVYVDALGLTVGGFSGPIYNFVGLTVGGTANAITVTSVVPTTFALNAGTQILFTPILTNTGPTTLNVLGTGVYPITKVAFSGVIPLVGGEIVPSPVALVFDGVEWIYLNFIYEPGVTLVSTNTAVPPDYVFGDTVCTAALTLTLARTTTGTYPYYFTFNVMALGGNVTLTPNAADVIKVNGTSLSAGTSFVIPQGTGARLSTDVNGNWYVNFVGTRLNKESSIASATTTDLGTMASNIGSISGTTTITSFGSSANVSNPLYFIRFTGSLLLTNNATSLTLPGAANITTQAGDCLIAKYEGSGNWRVTSYTPAAILSTSTPKGRVTLSTGVPVLAADITAATTVYYTPYIGNTLPIYNGGIFVITAFTELSLALDSNSGHTGYQQSGKNFDLFVYNDAGTIRLGTGPAWSSDTARGTGAGTTQLTLLNGIWVNTVAITLRFGSVSGNTTSVGVNQATYVGTMRATADGQTSMQFKLAAASGGTNSFLAIYNAYNRVNISSISKDSTASWNYTTNAFRAANNSNSNRISFIDGLQQSPVTARYVSGVTTSSTGISGYVALGMDTTTSPSGTYGQTNNTVITSQMAGDIFIPVLGFHYVQAIELSSGSTTTYTANGVEQALIIALDM